VNVVRSNRCFIFAAVAVVLTSNTDLNDKIAEALLWIHTPVEHEALPLAVDGWFVMLDCCSSSRSPFFFLCTRHRRVDVVIWRAANVVSLRAGISYEREWEDD